MARFGEIDIVESDNGLTLTPPGDVSLSRIGMTKEVPRLGVLNVYDAGHPSAPRPPAWKGQETNGGELYVDRKQEFFLLVTETAITSIQPVDEGDRLDSPDRLSLLQDLSVHWG